ncbi:MAG: hypothetical protein ACTSR2_00965 [Candidatus Hodarchaeales archaeon]
MEFIEPLKQEKKLKDYLDTGRYKRVALFWGHGIGDSLMFQVILDKLREMYPDIEFRMALPKGLDEEVIYPDAVFVNSREEAQNLKDFDLVAQINFPLETDPNLTKSELCCKTEIGIEPVAGHKKLPEFPSPLVAVHFNLTSLPELANPSEEVAKMIWEEIKSRGAIPIETHFEHCFHNPVNKRFEFVNRHVRDCKPRIKSLIGLIQHCQAFIGCVSGNFHVALSTLPPDRICYLEKKIPVKRFTHLPIKTIKVEEYKDGSVAEWLKSIGI